jgi:hypothetical protein
MKTTTTKLLSWIFPILVLFAIAFLPKIIKRIINPPQKILLKDYSSHLFRMQHDYVYQVILQKDGKSVAVHLVKTEKGDFDIWQPGENVNRIYAAALMVDSTGKCLTSEYAAEPWNNKTDIDLLKRLFADQTGISADNISVGGTTIQMTIKSALQLSKGNEANEIECIAYPDDDNIGTRFIGRKNRLNKLPVKDIAFGTINTGNLRKNDPLYFLKFPNIDFGASLPFSLETGKLKINRYESFKTSFQSTGIWLPEGTAVFDKDMTLVGIYSVLNNNGGELYIANMMYNRRNRDLAVTNPLLQSVLQETVNDIIELQAIADTIKGAMEVAADDSSLIDKKVNYVLDNATEKETSFPFSIDADWELLEEIVSDIGEVAEGPIENYFRKKMTNCYDLGNTGARCRIKIEGGANAYARVELFKDGEENNYYDTDILKPGTKTLDYDVTGGCWKVRVSFNSVQTRIRLVFEKQKLSK